MFKIIIVGGMAAGCKAAARLSRLSSDFQITLIERSPFISIENCGLPLYAAGEIDDYLELAKTGFGIIRDENYFLNYKSVKVLTNCEVENIDTIKCEVKYTDRIKNETNTLPYNALIIATGSRVIEPDFPYKFSPFVSSFYSPIDAKNFKDAAQKGKVNKAIIIGGGFTGCELTESLRSLWGIETILIEKEESLLENSFDPEVASIVENKIRSKDVEILLSTEIEKIESDQKGLPVVILKDGTKKKSDYVFFALGTEPESALAKNAGIKIGSNGGIVVDENMKTNIPGIWAAGGCVEIKNLITGQPDYLPIGSLSNRMGIVAADSVAKVNNSLFRGFVGTISSKIFDTNIATSGLTEKKAKKYNYNAASVVGTWPDRSEYHPDVKNLFGKLVYEKGSLRLLGMQLIGEGEVTRYIDVFSELLVTNKTAYDLLNLEHCFSPAHSSPVSPLNCLGSMVINQEINRVNNINPNQLASFDGRFIDLREPSEVDNSLFSKKAIRIPFPKLRESKAQFNNDQKIIFVCGKGPRAYEAARLFMNYGFKNVSYLGGGNAFCKAANINIDN